MNLADIKAEREEIFQERAGIIEYEGKVMRSRAEIAARIEADEWLDARKVAARDSEVCK